MSNWQVFPNAPIVEAIFDIRAQLSPDFDPQVLSQLGEQLPEHYQSQKQNFFKGGITLKEAGDLPVIEAQSGIQGFQFKSEQEQKVIQAQVDGFVFSKLRPYNDWCGFFLEAKELWQRYATLAEPVKILRIALRYINRIEAPFDFSDFNEYILTNPQIAPNLPQALSYFFMKIELPFPEIGAHAIITQTMDKPTQTHLPLIIDIDVFKTKDYELSNDKNIELLWDDFGKLRDIKNDIFFNSVTDKAKELFA